MFAAEARLVLWMATAVDVLTAVVVAYHAAWALALIARGRGPEKAKLVVADGVISALGFGVAGSLLKTIALEDWQHIRMFAFVLVFRTLLKQVFQREQMQAARSGN